MWVRGTPPNEDNRRAMHQRNHLATLSVARVLGDSVNLARNIEVTRPNGAVQVRSPPWSMSTWPPVRHFPGVQKDFRTDFSMERGRRPSERGFQSIGQRGTRPSKTGYPSLGKAGPSLRKRGMCVPRRRGPSVGQLIPSIGKGAPPSLGKGVPVRR